MSFSKIILIDGNTSVLETQGLYVEGVAQKVLYEIQSGILFSQRRFSKIHIHFSENVGFLGTTQQPGPCIAIFKLDGQTSIQEGNLGAEIPIYRYVLMQGQQFMIDTLQTITFSVYVSAFEAGITSTDQYVPWDEQAYLVAQSKVVPKINHYSFALACDILN